MKSSPMHALFRLHLILVIASVSVFSGCIVVPLGGSEEKLFVEERIDFIEIGKSTKTEVAQKMSQLGAEHGRSFPLQPINYQGNVWLYSQQRAENRWLVLYLPCEHCGGDPWDMFQGADHQFLSIHFDDTGVVTRYHFSSLENRDGNCNRSGVCALGSSYLVAAPRDEARNAKLLRAPPDQCGVYIWTDHRSLAHTIWIDEERLGWLRGDQHFLFIHLEPGKHQYSGKEAPEVLNCQSGETVFLESSAESGRALSWLERRDDIAGRQAVSARQLLIKPIYIE